MTTFVLLLAHVLCSLCLVQAHVWGTRCPSRCGDDQEAHESDVISKATVSELHASCGNALGCGSATGTCVNCDGYDSGCNHELCLHVRDGGDVSWSDADPQPGNPIVISKTIRNDLDDAVAQDVTLSTTADQSSSLEVTQSSSFTTSFTIQVGGDWAGGSMAATASVETTQGSAQHSGEGTAQTVSVTGHVHVPPHSVICVESQSIPMTLTRAWHTDACLEGYFSCHFYEGCRGSQTWNVPITTLLSSYGGNCGTIRGQGRASWHELGSMSYSQGPCQNAYSESASLNYTWLVEVPVAALPEAAPPPATTPEFSSLLICVTASVLVALVSLAAFNRRKRSADMREPLLLA